MGRRVLVILVLAMASTACAASQGEGDWACANPEHGDYFMDELFDSPAVALASVDDESTRYQPTEADTGRAYVLRDADGDVERLVELQSQGDRWGVISVTSCTGFGWYGHAGSAARSAHREACGFGGSSSLQHVGVAGGCAPRLDQCGTGDAGRWLQARRSSFCVRSSPPSAPASPRRVGVRGRCGHDAASGPPVVRCSISSQ